MPELSPLLTISGAFCISLHAALTARFLRLRDPASAPFRQSLLVQALTNLLVGVPLIIGILGFESDPISKLRSGIGGPILIALFCHVISQLLYLEALRLADVALVSSFAAVSPAVTVLTGWIVFAELPRQGALIGIALIACGIVFLHVPMLSLSKEQLSNGVSRPWYRSGLAFAFASGVIPAFGQTAAKGAILHSSVPVYQALTLTFTGLISLTAFYCFSGRSIDSAPLPSQDIRSIALLSVVFGIGSYMLSAALATAYVANVAGMSRISIVFHVLLAYLLNVQRAYIRWRSAWATVIFIGVLLIARSG